MAMVTLVWARGSYGQQVEHLVAEPTETREMSACSSARQPKGSWEQTPVDAVGIERCAKCLKIGGPGGWGAELVKRESE